MTIRDIEVKTGYPGRNSDEILSKAQKKRKKEVEESGGVYDIIHFPSLLDPNAIRVDTRIGEAMDKSINRRRK